jgi:UDP-GlcNAc:undecaprenyl-phosphate/decaprenyl-phosphate GlcNAc-1-phosphate transferase
MTTTLLFAFAGSWALSYLLIPLVQLVLRCQGIGRQHGDRAIHARPVPGTGGPVVLVSGTLVVTAVLLVPNPLSDVLQDESHFLLGLLLACMVVAAVGVADSYDCLSGSRRLLGQMVAVLIMVQFDLVVREIRLFGWGLELGPLTVPVTCILLLGAINAFNLIDDMDGLLGSMGFILSAAFAILATLVGSWGLACVPVALTGALLGFLRYNLPPASIGLGSAGRMLIGLVLGAIAIKTSIKGPATAAMTAPMALFTIPFLDTGAALIRRKLTGRSLSTADCGHLHHCLLGRGLSRLNVLALVAFFCLLTVSGALISVALEAGLIALVTATSVACMLVATQVFGHVELLLIRKHMSNLPRFLLHGSSMKEHQTEVRLQGSLDWAEL